LQYIQEYGSWIFDEVLRCAREPSACVSTVQFWVAIGTGAALIAGFARWVAMKARKTTVEDRLERIEGQVGGVHRRGSGDDCELVRAHRTLFTRPAFMTSCMRELSILLLADVIDETIAALGTGTHYDDKGQVRAEFADLHSYRRRGHRKNIGLIYQHLRRLQVQLKDLDQYLRHWPAARYPEREFISAGLRRHIEQQATWQEVLGRCDRIDAERNNVLILFNGMLQQCREPPLPLITLSSTYLSHQIKRG
jgi:hypothetical protein